VTLNSRCCDSMRPAGQLQVAAADGVFHVLRGQAVAASLSGSSHTRMAYFALAEDAHIGHAGHRLQARLDDAVDQVVDLQARLSVSLVKASQITGKASASTLAMTGSSIACGRRLRTREVRSRTSAAAASASFSSRKRTEIWPARRG
jgi:hypothetical protein